MRSWRGRQSDVILLRWLNSREFGQWRTQWSELPPFLVRRQSYCLRVTVEKWHNTEVILSLQNLTPGHVCWLSVGSENPETKPSKLCDIQSILPSRGGELLGRVWKHWDPPRETASWQGFAARWDWELCAYILWIMWLPSPPSPHRQVNCWAESESTESSRQNVCKSQFLCW
jgi:hypothetical protein